MLGDRKKRWQDSLIPRWIFKKHAKRITFLGEKHSKRCREDRNLTCISIEGRKGAFYFFFSQGPICAETPENEIHWRGIEKSALFPWKYSNNIYPIIPNR